MSVYLGFDTSNYTTSVAASDNGVLKSKRKLLEVSKGQRGLRQSDAVFAHLKALPTLYKELLNELDISNIKAVGVSTRPRNVEGSYMPCFLTGEGYAKVVADTLKVPLYTFSHQDGHIMAGVFSSGEMELLEDDFLSVHLSGGTTEILKSRYNGYSFDNEIVGGTKDISAGQLIDRIGVMLGLEFPCGKELEKLAEGSNKIIKTKVSAKDGYINFSGAETQLGKMIGIEKDSDIARAVFENIKEALSLSLIDIMRKTNINKVLMVGGVASNSLIREELEKRVSKEIYFASKEYSCDNATGIALLAEKGEK